MIPDTQDSVKYLGPPPRAVMYVAMENLERVVRPDEARNPAVAVSSAAVSRWFSHFDWEMNRYVPLPALTYQYPDRSDTEIDGARSTTPHVASSSETTFSDNKYHEACQSLSELTTAIIHQLEEPLKESAQQSQDTNPDDVEHLTKRILSGILDERVYSNRKSAEVEDFFGLRPDSFPGAENFVVASAVRDALATIAWAYYRRIDRQLQFSLSDIHELQQVDTPIVDMRSRILYQLGDIVEVDVDDEEEAEDTFCGVVVGWDAVPKETFHQDGGVVARKLQKNALAIDDVDPFYILAVDGDASEDSGPLIYRPQKQLKRCRPISTIVTSSEPAPAFSGKQFSEKLAMPLVDSFIERVTKQFDAENGKYEMQDDDLYAHMILRDGSNKNDAISRAFSNVMDSNMTIADAGDGVTPLLQCELGQSYPGGGLFSPAAEEHLFYLLQHAPTVTASQTVAFFIMMLWDQPHLRIQKSGSPTETETEILNLATMVSRNATLNRDDQTYGYLKAVTALLDSSGWSDAQLRPFANCWCRLAGFGAKLELATTDEVLADLDRALELEPRHFIALQQKGKAVLNDDNANEHLAEKYFNQAKEIFPWLSDNNKYF